MAYGKTDKRMRRFISVYPFYPLTPPEDFITLATVTAWDTLARCP
jgi:hypothetical protein